MIWVYINDIRRFFFCNKFVGSSVLSKWIYISVLHTIWYVCNFTADKFDFFDIVKAKYRLAKYVQI